MQLIADIIACSFRIIQELYVGFNQQTDEAAIGANNELRVFIAVANTGLLGCKMRRLCADTLALLSFKFTDVK